MANKKKEPENMSCGQGRSRDGWMEKTAESEGSEKTNSGGQVNFPGNKFKVNFAAVDGGCSYY